MSQQTIQTFTWQNAITLRERGYNLDQSQDESIPIAENSIKTSPHVTQWQEQYPFKNGDYFEERLAVDNLLTDDFQFLITETKESLRNRFSIKPEWVRTIEEAYAASNNTTTNFLEIDATSKFSGFLLLIKPLIDQGMGKIYEGSKSMTNEHNILPFELENIVEILLQGLLEQLIRQIDNTLVLELHVARLQGSLSGNTPDERFNSFVERLLEPDVALAIFEEYPVMAQQVVRHIDKWVNYRLEFLTNLCNDWEMLCNSFEIDQSMYLLSNVQGDGDQHNDGRHVLIATFESRPHPIPLDLSFNIVYKPRSLTVDLHFQTLLKWCNAHGFEPDFRTIKILDRGRHGWSEFVFAGDCETPDEIQRFYERQGGYLALLYLLQATDFHYENLIASGEHPVLIDLETLLHPHHEQVDPEFSKTLLGNAASFSVLNVGLLPERHWDSEGAEALEMSGFGATANQLSPKPVPYYENAGTDEMHLARERIPMPSANNRPFLKGFDIDVSDYTDAILVGFQNCYSVLLNNRTELQKLDGLLNNFAAVEVRVILRPTYLYTLLLREGYHPDLLRDALKRDQYFDKLWIGVQHQPHLANVISTEHADLWNGDVPLFLTTPESLDLKSCSGVNLPNFFQKPTMQLVYQRLESLSEKDLARQLWFVRAALGTLTMEPGHAIWPTYQLSISNMMATRDELLRAACAIGDRLEELAIWNYEQTEVTWIGLAMVQDKHWSLLPLGMELYDGVPGITLFLAYLAELTDESRYRILAKAAFATILHEIEHNQSYIANIGGFTGWGGLLYTLTQLDTLWNDDALLDRAEALLSLFPSLIDADDAYDVLSGTAGCLKALLVLYRRLPTQEVMALMIQCGDKLLQGTQSIQGDFGWIIPSEKRPLAGFSHGAAGISLALLEIAQLSGENRFQEVAVRAMCYERSLFSAQERNWPDLRELDYLTDHDSQNSFMSAWCHGAPGIGLARLQTMKYLDDSEIYIEIEHALACTLANGFGANHSLCHGDLGNLDLLLQASHEFNDEVLRKKVYQIAKGILESISQRGWLCGVPLDVETPGLMTGLAGIGYELLRLAEPEKVSCVLTLEPPKL